MLDRRIHASPVDPDAIANAIVAIPTVCVAAGVVVWLRENLERRERTDPLTGLGNRRALMEALETAVVEPPHRLLVLFDLDGFKRYNDRLGHAAGDALLDALGARAAAAVAGRGEAFRLGGDELCVLLDDATAARALRRGAARGRHRRLARHAPGCPHEADTPSAALSLADDRMYAAKRAVARGPLRRSLWGSESASASSPRRRSGRTGGGSRSPADPSPAALAPSPASGSTQRAARACPTTAPRRRRTS